MLRLSKWVLAGVGSAALIASAANAQGGGLGSRLDAQEQKLTQDEQTCHEVNLAEYAQLLQEASQNKARADKAAKKGIPVNQAQVDADLAKAMQLFARAQMAQARQCMMQAQQQPQPKTTGALPGPTAASGVPAGQSCTPAKIEPANFDLPEIPSRSEVDHIGELLEDAAKGNRLSEADYLLKELDGQAAKLRQTIHDAKQAGEFSKIDVHEAEKRLEQIEAWRKWGEKYRLPCPPPEPKKPTQTSLNLPSWARDMLAAHNAARAAVGSPPLEWNAELQKHATARAGEIAQLRQLTHAPREGRGTERENILSAPIGYSPDQMMGVWLGEKSRFHPGVFPDVCDGDWSQCAHYTQMIWSTTIDIGCGFAQGGGFNWLVCRYNPGGNKDGKPVIAENHWIRPRLTGGDYIGKNGAGGGAVIADNSGIAPETSKTATTPPPPPPPPTASDEAPGGNEDNHPLVGYGAEAFIRHSAAVDCGNTDAADAELAKLRYAIDELRKRLRAAKKAGKFSTVKPDDVQRQINLLESFLRAAEQRKPKGACPPQPPVPPPATATALNSARPQAAYSGAVSAWSGSSSAVSRPG